VVVREKGLDIWRCAWELEQLVSDGSHGIPTRMAIRADNGNGSKSTGMGINCHRNFLIGQSKVTQVSDNAANMAAAFCKHCRRMS